MDTFQALSSQMQALQAEIQSMKEKQTQSPSGFVMQNGATSSSGETVISRVDLTRLGKSPKPFEGTAETWEAFKFNFTTYVGTVDPRLPELLDDASRRTSAIDMTTALTRADRDKAIEFYAVLNGYLKEKTNAHNILKAQKDRNGFEVWRLISAEFEPQGFNKHLDWLSVLHNPTFPKKEIEFQAAMQDWETEVADFESQTGRTFDEDSKLAVLNKVMPAGIKPFVAMQQTELKTYQQLRSYVVRYLQSKKMWTRADGNKFGAARGSADGPSPMDIGALGGKKGKGKDKGKGKPDKPETCKTCGKKLHRRMLVCKLMVQRQRQRKRKRKI